MKVALMFSGGKDSTQAVGWCKDQDYEIKALIAVKPSSPEAYLWHYATVEHTSLQAKALGLPLIYLECNEFGPEVEAGILAPIFDNLDIDAVILGGVGLQRTQIREIRKVAGRFGIETIVPYESWSSEELLCHEIENGLEIIITEVAAAGLTQDWIGKKLDLTTLNEIRILAKKYGFDPLGEGGSYNTYVLDAPFFKNKIKFLESKAIWDSKHRSGFLDVKKAEIVTKIPMIIRA